MQASIPIRDIEQGTHTREFTLKDTSDSAKDVATLTVMPVHKKDIPVQLTTAHAWEPSLVRRQRLLMPASAGTLDLQRAVPV